LQYDLKIGYDEKSIEESINTKFLGLQIDNHLNWKNHIDLMIPKLSTACYAISSISQISTQINLFCPFPVHNDEIWNNFFGVIPPTVK
jgi:hypothetical protein